MKNIIHKFKFDTHSIMNTFQILQP